MRQVIYLIVTSGGVDRMTKRTPEPQRGELPVKLTVTIDPKVFKPPTISQEITIADPFEGLNIEQDVELRQQFITAEEADIIRRRRMGRMRDILESAGYKVEGPEDGEQPGD